MATGPGKATKGRAPVTSSEVRAWANAQPASRGLQVAKTGKIPERVVAAWDKSHPARKFDPSARAVQAA